MSRPLYVVASVIVAGAIVLSALSLMDVGARASERRTAAYPGVATLRVEAASGDVRVTGADVTRVEVSMRLTKGLSTPRPRSALRNGTLVLDDDCPGVVLGSCSVDYDIRVPRGAAVVVDSSAGDVEASALTAGADLETSAGEVVAEDVGGTRVRLASSAGDVTGRRLTAAAIDASSSAGEVDLDVARVPDRVDADSGAGDVRVRLPDAAYAVEADTGAGEENVSVRRDDASPRTVRARSSAGDVVVGPR